MRFLIFSRPKWSSFRIFCFGALPAAGACEIGALAGAALLRGAVKPLRRNVGRVGLEHQGRERQIGGQRAQSRGALKSHGATKAECQAECGEGLRLLQEGAADAATLDALLRQAGGFRMGPFELMDLIGHDVNYAVTRSVFDAYYGDTRFEPSLVQLALVEAGRLGRKTGRGFYDYRGEHPVPTR